ncbi:ABC-type transport auxiliary lipoprotein family protein [Desulfurivibrio alkaliphilus]|uniref:ABC-type transport auxiliary lipoprotein component domain-containing protein n=1 Tax=Desulfurivibrio alkaliphilus (strain DSM 19089 / UNIQEM U267 / AHT2) TaxID=589865 RepID=D6Z3S4_DESAT|nr:ABC-type transport auxiliary lipoprotein family protein [Desulfurivibrio alkaliphilus]ADH86199.1 protein of unknown function DUF330 [Desulfurivibrio alkaliphilus AHT 2]
MRVWLSLLVVLLWISGCGLVAEPPPAPAYYELRLPLPQDEPLANTVRVGQAGPRVEVLVPSWLRSRTMQYRLAYRDDGELRRREYRESRWVAEPGEMIARSLERYFANGRLTAEGDRPEGAEWPEPQALAAGLELCRLRLTLDEFVQIFQTASDSHTLLEVRAELISPAGTAASRRKFAFRQQAPSPDAFGGVVAHRRGLQQLAEALQGWLEGEEVREALAKAADDRL